MMYETAKVRKRTVKEPGDTSNQPRVVRVARQDNNYIASYQPCKHIYAEYFSS